MISIPFEKTNGTYTLTDSIVLPEDHDLNDEQIEQIKQQRFDNWVAVIINPVESAVKTLE